jgi:hypothetical protein
MLIICARYYVRSLNKLSHLPLTTTHLQMRKLLREERTEIAAQTPRAGLEPGLHPGLLAPEHSLFPIAVLFPDVLLLKTK